MNFIINIVMAALFNAAPASAAGQHTVVAQDTMWDLALRYYKDNYLWTKIAEANPAPSVKDPHWIYPGQVLIIPDIEGTEAAPMDTGETTALPEPEPEPEPEQVVAAPAPKRERAAMPGTIEDSLSTELPEGQPSAQISMRRLKAYESWQPDGEIVGFGDSDTMVAQGDLIDVKFPKEVVSPGDRFEVYRRAAPTEADEDQKAKYLVYVGRIEIRSVVKGNIYRSLVLVSTDALTGGDLVKRGR